MKIVVKKIKDLKPAEYNPRLLTSKAEEDIRKSLEIFGFVDPVIINTFEGRENVIIGGHQRVKVWGKMGNTTVPCVELSLNPTLEKELNIRLNANTGSFDWQMLEAEFSKEDLLEWGFEANDFPIEKEKTDVTAHERTVGKQFILKVMCKDQSDYDNLKARMESQGRECK